MAGGRWQVGADLDGGCSAEAPRVHRYEVAVDSPLERKQVGSDDNWAVVRPPKILLVGHCHVGSED